MMRRLFFSTTFLILALFAFAQDTTQNPADMADFMRSSGKIYVVIAVILTIFLGIIIYLVRLDKKITKLEKEIP